MAGYSGTPLAQKLGMKPDTTVVLINAPANYRKLLGNFANGVKFTGRVGANSNFIHFFTTCRSELEKQLRRLRTKIADSGTLWVSWAKKSSGVASVITEDVIPRGRIAPWVRRYKGLRRRSNLVGIEVDDWPPESKILK